MGLLAKADVTKTITKRTKIRTTKVKRTEKVEKVEVVRWLQMRSIACRNPKMIEETIAAVAEGVVGIVIVIVIVTGVVAEEGEAERGTEKEIAIAIERCRVTDVVEMNLKKNLTTIL